tara:strand:+ start:16366 stop:16668 length:303 start_codon:yes stop_codon:yes gene_type:complete
MNHNIQDQLKDLDPRSIKLGPWETTPTGRRERTGWTMVGLLEVCVTQTAGQLARPGTARVEVIHLDANGLGEHKVLVRERVAYDRHARRQVEAAILEITG